MLVAAAILLATGGFTGVTTVRAPVTETAAKESPADVTLQISTITPLSPGPKDTLRISGRVVSHGGAALTGVQVSLHLGRPVSSRTELQGLRVNPVAQELATRQPQDIGDGRLRPGQSLAFTITVAIRALSLAGDGVYPMQVLATGAQNGAYRDLATASTFLPYVTADEARPPTPLAWLVPLSADPSLLADGTFTDDAVGSAVSPGGRLRQLLDGLKAAASATATIDPALIRALTLASNGNYVVAATPTAPKVTKPASRYARQWLADLNAASQVSLAGLPYANPDVEALLHAGGRSMVDAAQRRAADVLSLGLPEGKARLTPEIAVPPGGHVDQQGAAYYRQAKAQGLVLAADSVPPTGDNPSASASSPGVPTRLLLADDVLTNLAVAGPKEDSRLAEQDILAELAESHLEDRFAAGFGSSTPATAAQPLLIAPPQGWSTSAAWLTRLLADTARVPWLKQVTVKQLLTSAAEPRAELQYPTSARAGELPSVLVDAGAQISAVSEGLFRPVKPGDEPQPRSPQSIVQPIRDAALASVASSWRGDLEQVDVFQQSARQAFASLQQQVKVVASPQITLTSRSGRVPVTLENNLDAAVDVSLELTSLDRSRVSSGTVIRRTVRAGQKVQVEVEVKAASAGTFPVRLALFTPDGQSLGTPAQVLVRSTTYGVVATVFTTVALSLLGLAVLLRAIRALLRRSRPHAGAGTA